MLRKAHYYKQQQTSFFSIKSWHNKCSEIPATLKESKYTAGESMFLSQCIRSLTASRSPHCCHLLHHFLPVWAIASKLFIGVLVPASLSLFSTEQPECSCTKCQNMSLLCWEPSRGLPILEQKPNPLQRPSRSTRALHPTSPLWHCICLCSCFFSYTSASWPWWSSLECLLPRHPTDFWVLRSTTFKSLLECHFFQGGLPWPPRFKLQPPSPPAFPTSLRYFKCIWSLPLEGNLQEGRNCYRLFCSLLYPSAQPRWGLRYSTESNHLWSRGEMGSHWDLGVSISLHPQFILLS